MEIQTGFRLKHAIVLMATAFAVTLAVMVGKQMSGEAMAVVIGIVCGVLAAVPTTVILTLVLLRADRTEGRAERREARGGSAAYPPVVVIQGGQQGPSLPAGIGNYWPGASLGTIETRDFRVVGGGELLEERR